MTRQRSVLAFITTQFAAHPENIATEALSFILDHSRAARTALLHTVRQLGQPIPDDLSFATQVADGAGARPDLIGRDSAGRVLLLIEAKFWAGLTDNQPMGYLGTSLFDDSAGCVLFVAPEQRLPTLWPELLRRAGLPVDANPEVDEGGPASSRRVMIGRHRMALLSWRTLLQRLQDAARDADDLHASEDLRQLAALCEEMDTSAFLPLQSEELTSTLGRRVEQFCALADDVTNQLVQTGEADVKGLRATGGAGYYGRYMKLNGYGAFLHFNAKLWAAHGRSPLWLTMGFKDSPVDAGWLRRAGVEHMPDGVYCRVPIYLPTHAERDTVLAEVLRQVRRVVSTIPVAGPLTATPPSASEIESAADDSRQHAGAGPIT